MRGGQAGRARERQVAEKLRDDGYIVLKGTTYGAADLVALKRDPSATVDHPHASALLVEVKSTAGGPYERFGPGARAALSAAAFQAGARAVLAWWPPRRPLELIPEAEWPT